MGQKLKYIFFISSSIFLLCLISHYSHATKDKYPNSISALGGTSSYCLNSSASPITSTITTTTCGAGGTADINITYTWYKNTVNSTSGGTSVQVTNVTTSTLSNSYTPPTTSAGTLYYYCIVSWGAGANCATPGSITTALTQTINIVTIPASECYCTSFGTTTYSDGIVNVTFAGINNNSTKPGSGNAYTNYSGISPGNVAPGSSYDFIVYVNTNGNYTNYQYVWIDWNQNGSFADAGESYSVGTVTNSSNGLSSLCPLSIAIPGGATIGLTRMRVSSRYNANPTECLTAFDGEVEDYLLNVCQVNPGTISKTTANICPVPSSTTLSIDGYTTIGTTIEWQYSTDNVNFSPASGTNNLASYTTASLGAGTYYYRAKVYNGTCASYSATCVVVANAVLCTPSDLILTGFETCGLTLNTATDGGSGTMSVTNTVAPRGGSRHASITGGSDGSLITTTPLVFVPGRIYTVTVFARIATCIGTLQIMKSSTTTNTSMKAASGNDAILVPGTNNVTSASYSSFSASFSVSAAEQKYIGIQLQQSASGPCGAAAMYVDDFFITSSCSQCSNGIQDGDETSIDCGGTMCYSTSPVGGTASGTASYACGSGNFSSCLTGYTGNILWQQSTISAAGPFSDMYGKTTPLLSGTVNQTTYFRAKLSNDGCSPVAYSNVVTITITGTNTNTWNGSTGTWGTNGNWSLGHYPTACEDAIIISGIVTAGALGLTVCKNLTISGTGYLIVNQSGANTFIVNGDFSVTGGGTFRHDHNVSNGGSSANNLITLAGPNNFINVNGGVFPNNSNGYGIRYFISAGGSYYLSSDFNPYFFRNANGSGISFNSYTFIMSEGGRFDQDGTSAFMYCNTGTFENQGGALNAYTAALVWDKGTFYGNYANSDLFMCIGVDDDFYNVKMRVVAPYKGYFCQSGTIANDFEIVSGTTLDAQNFSLTIGESGNGIHGPTGDFINNGTFTANTSTLIFKGENAQKIRGTSSTTFYNLTINNTGYGVTQNQPVTINNVFSLSKGSFVLNSLTTTIVNSVVSAISRTLGYVVSETDNATNPSILQWNIGTTTGSYVFPFGTQSGKYIPVTFNNSGDVGNVSISTRPTSAGDNQPWPAVVSEMSGAGTNITSAADRWWEVTSSLANPLPPVDLIFSYLGSENSTTTSPTDNRGIQHWNSTLSCWDDGKNSGCATVTASANAGVTTGIGSVSVSGITQFSPFIVVRGANPLPITLLTLSAYAEKDFVLVDWSTATEINNDYFTVERSTDGKEFVPVGTVKGAGNSSVTLNYEFIDINLPSSVSRLPASVLFYRLKQTDFDGQYSNSNIVAVEFNNETSILNVFPNPANAMLNIVVGNIERATVKIFDVTGQIVTEELLCNRPIGLCSIDISSLSNGVYFVSLSDGDDIRYARFVKD